MKNLIDSENKEELKNRIFLLETKAEQIQKCLNELIDEIKNIKNIIINCDSKKEENIEDNNNLNRNEEVEQDNKNNQNIICDKSKQEKIVDKNDKKSNKKSNKKSQSKLNIKFNFHYLELKEELEEELFNLLKNSIIKTNITLKEEAGFERKEIDDENKNIFLIISDHLNKYKKQDKDYLMKRAIFLKNISYLVRFSNEMGIYIFHILLKIFKDEIGFNSLIKDKIRLYFSNWIKKQLNEKCYKQIGKNEIVIGQIKNLIKFENCQENEIEIFNNLFPSLCKLYFHCYLTDIIVTIIYAKQDEEFNWDIMRDLLLTMVDDKNVLFTYLPGLSCNEKYFDNSQIYVVTYPIDNPNKYNFEKPKVIDVEQKIEIDLDLQINKLSFSYKKTGNSKKKLYEGKKYYEQIEVEFLVNVDIDIPKWDHPRYNFILLDQNNYVITTTKSYLYQGNYGRCICQIIINGKIIKESTPINLLI